MRLNLAFNAKEYAGETPYEDICVEAGVASRAMVKKFITVAMGASDEKSGKSRLRLDGIDSQVIENIHASALKRFPKLQLFKGWGIFAQNFEGQILKDVMLEGIKDDIVCLPVHDAIAVQQQHQGWAKEVTLETWQAHLDGVRTKVFNLEPTTGYDVSTENKIDRDLNFSRLGSKSLLHFFLLQRSRLSRQ